MARISPYCVTPGPTAEEEVVDVLDDAEAAGNLGRAPRGAVVPEQGRLAVPRPGRPHAGGAGGDDVPQPAAGVLADVGGTPAAGAASGTIGVGVAGG